MPPITLHYLFACSLCFFCAGWMIVKVLREKAPDPNNPREGPGGVSDGFVLPVFDPPGGTHLDDWLVDRMPTDEAGNFVPNLKRNGPRKRLTDRPARKHPVAADPGYCLVGWHTRRETSVKG